MTSTFTVNDKRGRGRVASSRLVTNNLNQEMTNLRDAGYAMPRNNVLARQATQQAKATVDNRTLTQAMQRTGMAKSASNMQMALPKIRQPLSSLEDKGIPFDTSDTKSLMEIRRWARIFYSTHDLIPLLVDIYSKFPLVGMEFVCSKDSEIQEFYEHQFLDTLKYETFLPDLAREYWISGEVTSLAHFSESLGVWEAEEILNPDTVAVSKSMFQREERVQLLVKPMVDALRDHGGSGQISESARMERQYEYDQLVKFYPEIIHAADRDDGLDMSPALVSRIVNKVSPWDLRGTPHLLRSFRALMMEESLNAAQDAVADRLYSPFILAKLGTADLGDGQPWIPTQTELDATRNDMQTALSADFRLMVHNFGLDVSSVFGREAVPRFDQDYDRINTKLMQAWGIGEALISGGGSQTYAGSALNREFVTQMMVGFQNAVRAHIIKRAEIVAEAQGHYDFELVGGQRKVIYREIVETDEETGEERIVKTPKLLIPEVKFSTLNLRDETQERGFLQTLKSMGVPISDKSLSVNIPIKFDEELDAQSKEQVAKMVAQAEGMKKAYDIIVERNLPVPPEMAAYYAAQQQLAQAEAGTTMAQQQADQAIATGEFAEDIAKAQTDMATGQAEMMSLQMQQMQAMPPGGDPSQMQPGMPQPTDQQSLVGPSGAPEADPGVAPMGPTGPTDDAQMPGMQMAAAIEQTPEFNPLNDVVKPFDTAVSTQPLIFPPTQPQLPKGVTEDGDNLLQKLPRPKTRPEESDEQRKSMPKRSLRHGPSHLRRKLTSSVHRLVEDPEFFARIGYADKMDQIRSDMPDLESMHHMALADPDFEPYSESYTILAELLEHHEYVTGEEPVW